MCLLKTFVRDGLYKGNSVKLRGLTLIVLKKDRKMSLVSDVVELF